MTLSNSWKALLVSAWVLLLVFVGCSILDPSDDDDTNVEVREAFDYTVEVGDRTVFRINGINGPMDIVGRTDCPSVEIWGEKIFLTDLGSENGTVIRRGSKVIEVRSKGIQLQTGDYILFGLAKVTLNYIVSQIKQIASRSSVSLSPPHKEFGDPKNPPVRSPVRCPHCASVVDAFASKCPSCGIKIAPKKRDQQ